MPNGGVGVVGPWDHFLMTLDWRMRDLASLEGLSEFCLPVGLCLVLDEKNGGDATAQELVKRLALLDEESGNIVDFYYLGWHLPHAPVRSDPVTSGAAAMT